jgi:hypothetical protein
MADKMTIVGDTEPYRAAEGKEDSEVAIRLNPPGIHSLLSALSLAMR